MVQIDLKVTIDGVVEFDEPITTEGNDLQQWLKAVEVTKAVLLEAHPEYRANQQKARDVADRFFAGEISEESFRGQSKDIMSKMSLPEPTEAELRAILEAPEA